MQPRIAEKARFYTIFVIRQKPLQQSPFRERHHPATRHDEMVKHAHIHQRERLLQRLRQRLVGTRRFGNAGRMVVREDQRARVVAQRALDDFARVYPRFTLLNDLATSLAIRVSVAGSKAFLTSRKECGGSSRASITASLPSRGR